MQKLQSINPADNSIVGEVACTSKEEIARKVLAAHGASNHWQFLGAAKRAEMLKPLLQIFKDNEEEIALTITNEIGKPIKESLNEIRGTYDHLHHFLVNGANYLKEVITTQEGNNISRVVFEPRGVAGCIAAWNFPFTNFVMTVIPNLIVGNVVIFKHSEECPLVGKLMEEAILKLPNLPQDVFSEIYGDGAVGEILLEQELNTISFIGSSKVGREIYAKAGKKFIKAVLEMGGSNPGIVFDDVNVLETVQDVYANRFLNCGQVCDAVKRLIVHKNVYPELVNQLKVFISKKEIGNPKSFTTDIGPLVAERQLFLLEQQVQASVDEGAQVILGGNRVEIGKGFYYQPTLLININRNMRVWREEVFGPVLSIVAFDTEEEAVTLANDTDYGLGAKIYSHDLTRARRIATRLQTGFVDINNGSHWHPLNPFGGHKFSGMGLESGNLGFQELCLVKVISEG